MEQEKKNVTLDSILKDFEYGFSEDKPYKAIHQAVDRHLIEIALRKSFGNQMKAAKILGINRNTLMAKVKKLGIDVGRWKI